MRTFTARLRWSFVSTGQPELLVGWGKAQEWDDLDECQVHLSVSREGRVTVLAGKQVMGEAQLASPVAGVYELTFRQEPRRVVIE